MLTPLAPKKLVGQRVRTSWAADQTSPLWRGFRARRAEVPNRVDDRSYSIQCYGGPMATGAQTPTTVFEKWAAVEVTDFKRIPPDMEAYELAGGLYAVFRHHGPAHEFARTMHHIYQEWMPASGYRLDPDRDHFEVFTDAYHPLDPAAEEDLWIPVMAVLG